MSRATWILAFGVASVACAGVWTLTAHGDRLTVLQAARAQLGATARLLEQHADRALEAGDRAVRAAVQAAGDPRSLHEPGRGERLHAVLRDLIADSPQIGSAWVMDATGTTIAENWAFPPLSRGPFRERPYFQAHLNGERGLHVGPAAIGPTMRRQRFTLSRPLLDPDGGFGGVATVGVFSDYFAGIYGEAGLGRSARFVLLRTDGAPLAVWPPEGGPGDPEARHPLPPLDQAGGAVQETADGLLVATRRLQRFPVLLAVSQPVEEVLAPWRERTLRSGGVMAAVILALGGLTISGLRGVRRQRALTAALRAERATLERRVAARTAALAESEARFRDMADNAPMMVWVTDPAGRCTYLSRSWYAFTGQTPETGLGHGWLEAVHPEDRERTARIFMEANADRRAFRLDYRLRRHDGAWRWAIDAAAPRIGPDGAFLGYIGSVIDITERREAEERLRLMARELDHRAKNALAVVQAAVRLTPKEDAAAYARAIEGRVAALARAHSVLAEGNWRGATLAAVAEAELATFLPASPDPKTPRVSLDGPPILLTPAAVQAMSMTLHELATNATKYGALSRPEGRVAVAWSVDRAAGLLRLRWEERGGPPIAAPPIAAPPARRGFGSRVIETTIQGQLGGRLERRWEAEGLVCLLELPLARVEVAGGETPAAQSGAGAAPHGPHEALAMEAR